MLSTADPMSSPSSITDSPKVGPGPQQEDDDESVQIDMAEIAKKLNLPEQTVARKIKIAASNDHESHDGGNYHTLGSPQPASFSIKKSAKGWGSTPNQRPQSANAGGVSPLQQPASATSIPIPGAASTESSPSSLPPMVGSLKTTVAALGTKAPHQKHFVLLKRPSQLGVGDDYLSSDAGGERKQSTLSAEGGTRPIAYKTESSLSVATRNAGYLAVRKGSNLDPASNANLDPALALDGDTSEAFLLAAPKVMSSSPSTGFISLRRGDKKGSVIMSVHDGATPLAADDDQEERRSDIGSGGDLQGEGVANKATEEDRLLSGKKASTLTTDATENGAAPSGNSGSPLTEAPQKKHVHFPEDVVNQITIVHQDNKLIMQVEYNRPLVAYVGCLLSVVFLVVAWCQIDKAASFESEATGALHHDDITRGVAIVSSLAFLSSAFIFIIWCIANGIPGVGEKDSLSSQHHHRKKLIVYTLSAAVAWSSLSGAFMLHVTSINLVVYAMLPFILSYVWYLYKTRDMSRIDAVGLILSVTGTAVMIAGEVHRPDYQHVDRRWGAVTLAVVGALAETLRWNYQKQCRRYFSNGLLMVCSSGLAGLILLIVSITTGAFTDPIGENEEVISHLDRNNVGLFIGACIAMLAAIATSHFVSDYFDTLTTISLMAMAGPLCVLVFGWFGLPTMESVYRGVGGSSMAFGSFLLIATGFVYRRHVELVFALPGDDADSDDGSAHTPSPPPQSRREIN